MTAHAKIGTLVVTHGRLGDELLAAARTIVGEVSHLESVSIGWHDDVDESQRRIEEAVERVDQGRGVIILTDMFGGTPSNIALSLLNEGRLEIITGVNLPMVLKLAEQGGEESLKELALRVKEQGQKHITVAGELLTP